MNEIKTFDYVIVGGGSAGAVVASRLSEDPNISVCLVEAGKTGNSIVTRMPLGNLFQVPELPGFNNWKYKTTKQANLCQRIGYQPRGKALGGSSAINGMIYLRGHPDDYNQWEKDGCTGWAWDDVLPYFEKSLNELQVGASVTGSKAEEVFLQAAAKVGIGPISDFNKDSNVGAGRYQLTQFQDEKRKGERCSTAEAFLFPNLDRKNLHIVSGALVDRLVFSEGKVNGVIANVNGGQQLFAGKAETILCAGAFGTPAILMRSGIGPAEALQNLGIETVVDMPDVGNNLQDHLQCPLHYECKHPYFMGLTPSGIRDLLVAVIKWRKNGRGLAATSFTESGAFIKSNVDVERPDLQIHFFSGLVEDHGRKLHFRRGFSAHVCVLRPHSRGSVRLLSSNPNDAPLVDPNYLYSDADITRQLAGLRKLHEILEQDEFRDLGAASLQSINTDSDAELLEYIQENADTAYHPVGTCQMGADKHSVVSPQLKVNGIHGLRIADASIMPSIISGNTNAASIMIGERAADFIRSEH